MCGIIGCIGDVNSTEDRISSALQSIAHRGPDAQGVWQEDGVLLAHRRLAVIDLSDAGIQPMRRGTLTITYNGEIYNYLELRDELRALGHSFRTATDTEVLLAAYEQWGEDCLPRLNGMWAFAIWDTKAERLFCARDRMGIKPFYWRQNGSSFTFGSEIKAILHLGGEALDINRHEIAAWVTSGYSHSDQTWFSGIEKLPPGSCMTVTPRGRSIKTHMRQWWHLPEESSSPFEAEEALHLLSESVHLRLRSDVPVGFHLSGGLDSSAIVCLAGQKAGTPQTFSGTFDNAADLDERVFVGAMQNRMPLIHREVRITPKGFRDNLAEMIGVMDHPEAGHGAYNQFALNKAMRENGIVVSLGGQGGDELFGGYWHYLPSHMRTLIQRGKYLRLGKETLALLVCGQFLREMLGYFSRMRQKHAPHIMHPSMPLTAHGWSQPGVDLNSRLRDDIRYYLPALLTIEDRTSMAWSIESRVPFLDYRLVEYVFSHDVLAHISGPVLKHGLRQTLHAVLPRPILKRRDKRGFNAPLGLWLAGPLQSWSKDLLLGDDALGIRSILSRPDIEHMTTAHASGHTDHTDALYKALAIEVWLRRFRHSIIL